MSASSAQNIEIDGHQRLFFHQNNSPKRNKMVGSMMEQSWSVEAAQFIWGFWDFCQNLIDSVEGGIPSFITKLLCIAICLDLKAKNGSASDWCFSSNCSLLWMFDAKGAF